MSRYELFYRLGVTPWERYATVAAASIAVLLDRELSDRPRLPGRALDVGCGRGRYTPELTRRGWETVGVDNVARAIDEANAQRLPGATFVVADVTDLASSGLGSFDFFLDVGCFQGLTAEQRTAEGQGLTVLADADATLLMLQFGPSRWRRLVGGVSEADVAAAFPGWRIVSIDAADTAGLRWPMSRTKPQWYRLRPR